MDFSIITDWKNSIIKLLDVVENYKNMVDSVGKQLFNIKWDKIKSDIVESKLLLETFKIESLERDLEYNLMCVCDVYEDIYIKININLKIILDLKLKKMSIINLSMSYSNSIDIQIKLINLQLGIINDIMKNISNIIINISKNSKLSYQEILKLYDISKKSWLSTKLYISILLNIMRIDPSQELIIQKIIEKTKIDILKNNPNNLISPNNSQHRFIPVNPLQLMCYIQQTTHKRINLEDIPKNNFSIYTLEMPNSTSYTTYNLLPLFNFKYCEQYGKLASTTMGLNQSLIKRLDTIKTINIKKEPNHFDFSPATPDKIINANQSLYITKDTGDTILQTMPKQHNWMPFGCCRDELYKYNRSMSKIIMDGIEFDGWNKLNIAEEFNKINNMFGMCNATSLINTIYEEFIKIYVDPKTIEEYFNMCVNEDYIKKAITKICFNMLELTLVSSVSLGNDRVPYNVIKREAQVSQIITILQTTNKVILKIKQVFDFKDKVLKSIIKLDKKDKIERKDLIFKHFKELITKVSQPLTTSKKGNKDSDFECSLMTIKLYSTIFT